MDKVDIIIKHIGSEDFYDLNGTSMLTNILNAMEEYAKEQVKSCSIPSVVGRSEQLSCDCNRPKYDNLGICNCCGNFGSGEY